MDIENLSDIISGLSGEDIDRLRSLASSITGGAAEEKPLPAPKTPQSGIDIETLMKVKSVAEKMNMSNSKDAQLIAALKPYLSEERQRRAEQSIRLLNLIEILPYIKELFDEGV